MPEIINPAVKCVVSNNTVDMTHPVCKFRVDCAKNWKKNNPVPGIGELCFTARITKRSMTIINLKIGDGLHTWQALEYVFVSKSDADKVYNAIFSKIDDVNYDLESKICDTKDELYDRINGIDNNISELYKETNDSIKDIYNYIDASTKNTRFIERVSVFACVLSIITFLAAIISTIIR